MIHSPRSKSAFTLIELLIVITIIGILAAALLPRITGGPSRARDAQRKADLQQIATALALYADDHAGVYPATPVGGCVSGIATDLEGYMTTVPQDPQNAGLCPGDGGYGYVQFSTPGGTSFLIATMLEGKTASGPGHYQTDFDISFPFTDTYSERLTTNSANYCDGTLDCSAGIIYVVGR